AVELGRALLRERLGPEGAGEGNLGPLALLAVAGAAERGEAALLGREAADRLSALGLAIAASAAAAAAAGRSLGVGRGGAARGCQRRERRQGDENRGRGRGRGRGRERPHRGGKYDTSACS